VICSARQDSACRTSRRWTARAFGGAANGRHVLDIVKESRRARQKLATMTCSALAQKDNHPAVQRDTRSTFDV
jgi:hypothetical protein